MKLHPLLLAPIVLCAPALAEEVPSESPVLVEQLLADFQSSPESFQIFFHDMIRSSTAFYLGMPSIDESDSFEADKLYFLLTSSHDGHLAQRGLSSAHSPEFKAYLQEYADLNEKAVELCRSTCSEADFYEQLRNILTQAEQINDKAAYDSIRKELNIWEGLSFIAGCLRSVERIRQLVTQTEKSSPIKRFQQAEIDLYLMLYKLINGQIPIKGDEFPFNIASIAELERNASQLARIGLFEATFIDSSEDINPTSFAHQFKQCSFEQKALMFAFLAAQCRVMKECMLCQNNPHFKPEECSKDSLLPIYPTDGAYAAYWARYVELKSLENAKTTTVDVKGELAKLKEQNPEAAAYFAPLEQEQASAFLMTFLKKEDIVKRCEDKAGNLKKQLKENPEQAAELIHYGSQIVYAQVLAEMFDEYAALYCVLSK